VAYLGTPFLVIIPPLMKRYISSGLLVVCLLSSVALAQEGYGPQYAPSGMQSPPTVSPTTPPPPLPTPPGQPVPPPPPASTGTTFSPSGQQAWPPPGESTLQPTTPYVPPSQPVYQQPAPSYVVVPAQPAYQLAPWLAPPSPSLGLVPGASNPHWDVSIDALWLDRDTGRSFPLGYSDYNPASHARQAVRSDSIWTDDVWFPLAPGLRLQVIGRITDQMAIEATAWGLQDWSIGRTIYGDPAGETTLAHSDWLQMPDIDNSLGYTYHSEVANVEINQRFKLCSLDPYRAFSWLWGVRYFHMTDGLTLDASDLWTDAYETLDWQTKNDLVGMQLGVNWTWGTDRFQLSTEAKIGLFANIYSQHGVHTATGVDDFEPFDKSHGSTDLAAMFEFSLLLRYRVAQSLWLRAGYQFYGVSGLALAPRQLADYDADGSVGFNGLSLGVELTR
jgi:hypothetical protein